MNYLVILQVADINKECSGTKKIGRVHFHRYGKPKIDNGRVTGSETPDDKTSFGLYLRNSQINRRVSSL
jgi:hypothetical protein